MGCFLFLFEMHRLLLLLGLLLTSWEFTTQGQPKK